jgi:hypothetical protein
MLWLNDESSFKSFYGWTGLLFSSLIFLAFQIYEYRDYIKKKKLAGLDKVILLGAGGIRTADLAPNANNKLNYRLKYVGIHIGIGLVVYIVAILVNWPRLDGQIVSYEWQAPTLLYALLIIWVLTLFVGLITLVFDNSIDKQLDKDTNKTSRLYNHTFYWPVILFLIIFSASGYGVENVDHIFKLLDSQVDSHEVIANYQQDFQKAVWNRLCEEKININNKIQACNNNKEQSLVVVSASGGGIQASGWMAQVLTGLQDKQLGIGKNFTKAITLISSASGGSVGSMYYLDQFENGVLTSNALKKGKVGLAQVVENATDDWLNAVGWGLAFPDLFRAIGLPCVLNLFSQDAKYLDRGYALEKTWQNTLGKEIPTLDSRRKEILEGKIPIPVYNTTLVENGRPFLVSPMKFVPGTMADYVNASSKENLTNALDFKTLYNNCGANGDQACDLALTTAARLSASFPYVTPMARNDRKNYIKDEKGQTLKVKDGNGKETDFLQDYHVADGGYYDNAGAFTALQWLNTFLKYNNDRKESDHYINIKKVLVLQINAFPEDNLQLDQQGSKGFEVVTIGPINTLAGIRDSTQIARNHIFAQLLNDRWHDIEIKDFTISFPKFKEIKDKNGKEIPYNPPLSWRLTKNQRMNLEEAWQKDSTIRETVEKMKMFWLNA